jgi:hypothetical protein
MLRHLLKDDFLSEDERYHGICLFAPTLDVQLCS